MSSIHQASKVAATEVVVGQYGNVSELKVREVLLPALGDAEVRVRHTAIGVNFVDVYHRTGIYALPNFPSVLGVEAVGIVEAIGAAVRGIEPGQRVTYAGPPVGGYASVRNIPAARLLHVPDGLDDDDVAALLLRGITTHMLLTHVYPVKRGDTVLVHAAAGGLGLVLLQWAKRLGACGFRSPLTTHPAWVAHTAGVEHQAGSAQASLLGGRHGACSVLATNPG
ncbi:MAG TPA: alcohol dehydrogenase catalytic domain-containing protein [Frateuria sp.]|uniref:alcohol dehydrogenase catalytic domain-containing protein n=1 Tax=Frateuria sp. TaxID=2211372 RepID=UPI002DF2A2F0|nr:alcohol dehydrogenase catalytic domain-containing protein [Frateuria sp.]